MVVGGIRSGELFELVGAVVVRAAMSSALVSVVVMDVVAAAATAGAGGGLDCSATPCSSIEVWASSCGVAVGRVMVELVTVPSPLHALSLVLLIGGLARPSSSMAGGVT